MVSDIPKNAKNVAIGAAMQAARIVMENFGTELKIDTKDKHDFVTEVDRRSEKTIIQHLHRAFPEHSVLGEETGTHLRESDCKWIIDPLDGTTNYLHQIPMFAISIALEVAGELAVAVVYEPVRKELFTAEAGRGAYLNERRIRVSQTQNRAECLLATGFPFRSFEWADQYIEILRYFMQHTSGIRRPGAAAIDLCYLAAGRVDGFFEFSLHAWDIAAGALLVKEAGGKVTDFRGDDEFLYSGNIVASNTILHEWMLDAVANHISHEN